MNASNEVLTSSAVYIAERNIGKSPTRSIRPFFVLAKPEITLMVMISAGVGSLMASTSFRSIALVQSILGIGLLAAGVSALNQYCERELDGRMRRTSKRPLPAGELTPSQALVFGVAMSLGGLLYILLLLNALTALIGLLTLVMYLFVYTPLKTKTRLCTFVGAFPGAAPILMGWCATTNSISLEAWALYAILFLWQFPHFYAIGWLYREDYARAGMLMLPAVDGGEAQTTFRCISFSAELLIVLTAELTFIARMSLLYLLLAMILGFAFSHIADRACASRSKSAAKLLLHASVIYLPLLYLVMLIDRIHL